MEFDPVVIVAYLFGLFLLYVIMRVLLIPVRFIVRVLVNGAVGAIVLVALNWLGSHWQAFSLYVPVNPVTAVVTGFLGAPGVLMLLALRHWLVAPLY